MFRFLWLSTLTSLVNEYVWLSIRDLFLLFRPERSLSLIWTCWKKLQHNASSDLTEEQKQLVETHNIADLWQELVYEIY